MACAIPSQRNRDCLDCSKAPMIRVYLSHALMSSNKQSGSNHFSGTMALLVIPQLSFLLPLTYQWSQRHYPYIRGQRNEAIYLTRFLSLLTELDSIKKRGISDPRAYIQANHPTALLLETYAIKDSIWSIVDASVEDAIANLSWIDVKVCGGGHAIMNTAWPVYHL